jgi:hypothetical protein
LNYDKAPKDQAGVSGFGERLKGMLAATGMEQCKLVIIMGDNDGDPKKKFADIIKQITKAGLFGIPTKPRSEIGPLVNEPGRHVPDIVVLMIPWDDTLGAIETICFAAGSSKHPELATCIARFVKCAKAEKWPISKLAKLQVRCMLALLCPHNPDISFKRSWERGRRGPIRAAWPVSRREFSTITKYLKSLIGKYN